MLILSGGIIYQTDFRIEDLQTFFLFGTGQTIMERINEGARWSKERRHNLPGYPAGSDMACVPVNIVNVFTSTDKHGTLRLESEDVDNLFE